MISRRVFLLTPLALAAAPKKAERDPGDRARMAGSGDAVVGRCGRSGAESWQNLRKTQWCFRAPTPAIRRPIRRASGILTGRFPHVNGVIADGAAMRAEEVTLDAVLKVAGYQQIDGIDGLQAKCAAVLSGRNAGRAAGRQAGRRVEAASSRQRPAGSGGAGAQGSGRALRRVRRDGSGIRKIAGGSGSREPGE